MGGSSLCRNHFHKLVCVCNIGQHFFCPISIWGFFLGVFSTSKCLPSVNKEKSQWRHSIHSQKTDVILIISIETVSSSQFFLFFLLLNSSTRYLRYLITSPSSSFLLSCLHLLFRMKICQHQATEDDK